MQLTLELQLEQSSEDLRSIKATTEQEVFRYKTMLSQQHNLSTEIFEELEHLRGLQQSSLE